MSGGLSAHGNGDRREGIHQFEDHSFRAPKSIRKPGRRVTSGAGASPLTSCPCLPLCFLSVKVTLHDMILKNIEKIKRPRSSNADALY